MTLKQTIKNATIAAKTNGYDRFITIDDCGNYSIHQTRSTIWSDQHIIGMVKIKWISGILNTEYLAL